MTAEITTFDYAQVDAPIAEFLRTKERNMREIVGKAYTELGRELKEAQENLASHDKYSGVFEKWYTSIGFRRAKVYDLMNRYDLLRLSEDIGTQDLIEKLPVTLSYEISAPSSESTEPKRQAKAAVLDGEVKTLKEYREVVAKLEATEARAIKAESDYETVRDTLESVRKQNETIAVLKPKADRYDEFLDSDGLTTFTTVGKQFLGGMSAQKVSDFLRDEDVLYKRKVDGIYPLTFPQ